MCREYWVMQYRSHSMDKWTIEFCGSEQEAKRRQRELENFGWVTQIWDMWGGGRPDAEQGAAI